jgi:hypothetical protein
MGRCPGELWLSRRAVVWLPTCYRVNVASVWGARRPGTCYDSVESWRTQKRRVVPDNVHRCLTEVTSDGRNQNPTDSLFELTVTN